MRAIYKLLGESEWRAAQAEGAFRGSAIDQADGFVHFSTGEQLEETARRHFYGRTDLVCLEVVDIEALGAALKWEPSRGGDLFPHLYGPLPLSAVRDSWAVPLGSDRCPMPARPTP